MKAVFSFFTFIWEVFKIVIIALIIVVPIIYFLFKPFFVRGQSIHPSFQDGYYLIIDELSYRFSETKRGDVVVFKYPNNPSQRYIKRVIGLPGELVEINSGSVMVYSEDGKQVLDEREYLSFDAKTPGQAKTSLDENEYFVLGDNRSLSSDSRSWGALNREYIIGKVFIRAWPFTALAKIEAPQY